MLDLVNPVRTEPDAVQYGPGTDKMTVQSRISTEPDTKQSIADGEQLKDQANNVCKITVEDTGAVPDLSTVISCADKEKCEDSEVKDEKDSLKIDIVENESDFNSEPEGDNDPSNDFIKSKDIKDMTKEGTQQSDSNVEETTKQSVKSYNI